VCKDEGDSKPPRHNTSSHIGKRSAQVRRSTSDWRRVSRSAISQVAGDARIPLTSLICDQVEHIGTMEPDMMDVQELQDDELISQAREWRRRALRGEKDARGIAHELEREVRRRFGACETATQQPLPGVRWLGIMPQPAQRRWKPW